MNIHDVSPLSFYIQRLDHPPEKGESKLNSSSQTRDLYPVGCIESWVLYKRILPV